MQNAHRRIIIVLSIALGLLSMPYLVLSSTSYQSLQALALTVYGEPTTSLKPSLTVTSSDKSCILLLRDKVVTYTLTISNPLAIPLEKVDLSQVITPMLTPLSPVKFDAGFDKSCSMLPCMGAQVRSNTTAHVTVTYDINNVGLVGKEITSTVTLNAPSLTESIQVTTTAGPVEERQRTYLSLIRKPDRYAEWVKLAQPAGGASVNYLYVAQSGECTGIDQSLPADIFAATSAGIYQFKNATTPDNNPSWTLRSTAAISASHIINTSVGYFAGDFNQGGVLRSIDGGKTWTLEGLPNNNQSVYWLAESNKHILAAGSQGLFIRQNDGTWIADSQLTGAIFSVAASGDFAYAVQFGTTKDTLWKSSAGGDLNTWSQVGQLPGTANFIQTLELRVGGTPELLIGVIDNGIYRLGTNGLEPFSQGISLTAYGIWRDVQGRVYASFRELGGLQRFAATGGAGESLNSLPGSAPPISERLYTVNGRSETACNIIATGSREGNVWLRRIP